MTVVWSLPEKKPPIVSYDSWVNCRMSSMAKPRARTTLDLRRGPIKVSMLTFISRATLLAISSHDVGEADWESRIFEIIRAGLWFFSTSFLTWCAQRIKSPRSCNAVVSSGTSAAKRSRTSGAIFGLDWDAKRCRIALLAEPPGGLNEMLCPLPMRLTKAVERPWTSGANSSM